MPHQITRFLGQYNTDCIANGRVLSALYRPFRITKERRNTSIPGASMTHSVPLVRVFHIYPHISLKRYSNHSVIVAPCHGMQYPLIDAIRSPIRHERYITVKIRYLEVLFWL